MTTAYKLPALITGDPLEGKDSWFSVIVPIARTNLITNPSFEVATTSWSAFGAGSIARVATQQYHGAYSLECTPSSAATDGAFYASVTMTAGTIYAASTKIKGAAGVKYQIGVYTAGGTALAAREFYGTGRWQWQWVLYGETATLARKIVVAKASGASTIPFYVDGVQVEALADASESVSTYIDGDQLGLLPNQSPPAYLWTGTPHASTSTRSGLTRAGGQVLPLSNFGFVLTALIGLGLATPQNVRTEYARLDGAYDDYTRKPTRTFALAGRLSGLSSDALDAQRSELGAALDRDRVGLDQRMLLRYEKRDARCGDVRSNAGLLYCKYAGGLGGNTDSPFGEDAAIQFEQYLPYVQAEGQQGSALSVQLSVANANYIALRSPTGVWSAIGTGANLDVRALAWGKIDEYLYIGGDYTSFNGVANTLHIARYSPVTGLVTAMGSGAAGVGVTVYSIATAPNGDVWATGSFTSMGGAANSAAVAHWVAATSTWSGHTYPGGTTAVGLTIGPDGVVYVGDTTGKVYKWNGAAWTLLGTATGGSTTIVALGVAPDGNLYAGGSFTGGLIAGANGIARYTLPAAAPAWQTLNNAPASRQYEAIAFGANGLVYLGATNGLAAAYLYSYNGAAFTSLTDVSSGAAVMALAIALNGLLYFGGDGIATIGGVTFPDAFAVWTGGSAVPTDVNLPGTAVIAALAIRPDGTLAVGYNTSGSAVSAATTTVTNSGTGKSYPTLTVNGPSSGTSRIYQLVNYSTGRAIYLNYTINAGEVATFVFQPDALSFNSTFVGNLASKILAGSSEADFFLQPGANVISFYSADSTVTATLAWNPRFVSLDALTR